MKESDMMNGNRDHVRDGAAEDRNASYPEQGAEADATAKKPFVAPEVVHRGEMQIFGGSSYGP